MDLRSAPGLQYYFWSGVALTLIFAFLEPSGTRGAGMFAGILIWAIQIGLLLPLLIAVHISLQTIDLFNRLNPWYKLILSGMSGAVLFIPLGIGIDYVFALDDLSSVNGAKDVIAEIMDESSGIFFSVTLTWIAINAPRVLQLSFKETNPVHPKICGKNEVKSNMENIPQFYSLIPREIGNDVIYIKSELHYVRVVTTAGEKLVLYNLKDAVADLEKIEAGIRTHRSYWVSGNHIKKIITDKSRKYVIASNGHKVPISRRNSAVVKDFAKSR